MGSNGVDEVMISRNDEAECSEATVEIKIKTLDSQTYTLRVDKCVPVPALKDQIATVTGVLSEQQRLICRGKVLKDDQLLSAYHVEDGHTLHLVVRQPIPTSSDSLPDNPAADLASSAGRSHVGPSVVVGTFNLSEEGDGAFPDLGRIVSAVLSSFGISNIGNGSEGVDLLELAPDRLPRIPGLSGTRDSSRQQSGQAAATRAESDTLNGASPSLPIATSLEPQQPPVILDSLTTLVQYLSHMRHEFCASVRGDSNNSQAAGTDRNDVQESDAASRSAAAQGGLPTPAFLAEVMQSTRQLLIEQAAECLSQLTRHLENHANVTDSLARMSIQSSAVRLGVLLQNLGALLLELGRTTMTLRMGQTPADAVVNAGPAMFISTSGPNPIMVQPLPFQPGTSFGAIPMRTVQPGSSMSGGTLGSAFLPRNIDIRIRRGSLTPTPIVNQREPTVAPQSPGQTNPAVSSVANSVHQAAAAAGASGSPSSARGPEVRVVPIRTVVAAVPGHVGRSTSDSSRGPVGLFYPVLARVQHITSGNSNSARGSQAFDERHHSGLDTERAPIPESAGQQQNNTFTGRDGNRHSGVGIQDNQENSTQIHSRLDQLLRTIFPGEQIHFGGDVNFQDPVISSATQRAGTTEAAANTQEAASRLDDEATFLSDLLRQVMPIISQRTATAPNTVSSERADVLENSSRQTSSTQENSDVGTSRRQADSPSPPNSKRQKRE